MSAPPSLNSLMRRIRKLEDRVALLECGKINPAISNLKPDLIVDTVCQVMEVDKHLVFSRLRTNDVAWARQVSMYLVVSRLHWDDGDTGAFFNRERSTVTHAVATVRDRIWSEPREKQRMASILALLGENQVKEAA